MSPLLQFSIVFMPTGTVHVSAHILNLSSKYSSNILAWSCPGFMPNKMSHYWWSKTMEMAEGVATLFQGVRSVVRDSRNWLCTHFAVCFQLRPPREWQECIRRWVSPPQRQHKGNCHLPQQNGALRGYWSTNDTSHLEQEELVTSWPLECRGRNKHKWEA